MDNTTQVQVAGARELFRPAELPEGFMYRLLAGAVLPRPIAWVSSQSADGCVNLAPFSFFTVASRSPGAVVFSVGPADDGGEKDTLVNIRETGEFVVNIAGTSALTAVDDTSVAHPPEVDEFRACGIEPRPSVEVTPPSVEDALVSLECKLLREIEVGSDRLIIGEVVAATARHDHYGQRMHVDTVDVLGRMAGPQYVTRVQVESTDRNG